MDTEIAFSPRLSRDLTLVEVFPLVIICKKIPSQDGMQDYYLAVEQRPRKVPFLRRIIEARIDRKKETIPSRVKP